MDNLIRKIYTNLIQDKEDDDIDRELKAEVLKLLQDEKDKMQEPDYAEYRDKAFLFANAGEEAGFVRGVRYTFELFLELLEV